MKLASNEETSSAAQRPRLLYVFTSALALRFLGGQFRHLRELGYDVTIISSPGEDLTRVRDREGVQVVPIAIPREISLFQDIAAVLRLRKTIRSLQPSIINVGTPKAGLLGSLVSCLVRVPCRVYTLYGLRLETTSGFKRRILAIAERFACRTADRVVCVSESLRKKVVSLRLVDIERTEVFASGSCNGVDVSEFDSRDGGASRAELRKELRIAQTAPVIGFVGRFTRDKGMTELLEAFSTLRSSFPGLRLLMVGDFEEGDSPADGVVKQIKSDPGIVRTTFVADAKRYYCAMDILVLPTYREGYPNVVLEAAASGKPAVVSDATGAVDSVVNGRTGLIVPVGDSAALADAVAKLLANPALASAMGRDARERVLKEFQPIRIWSGLARMYRDLLKAKNLPFPVRPINGQSGSTPQVGPLVASCAESSND